MKRREFLIGAGVMGLAGLSGRRIAGAPADELGKGRRIKIGQIGTGHAHAAGKMRAIRNLPQFYEVVGIAEPDARRRSAAEKDPAFAGLRWLTRDELLEAPGLQVVSVETEVCDLLSSARAAIGAGKHVHLDKPAGESLSEFKALLEESERRKLIVQMGYMFRYNPAFQLCYRAVREGWLGEIQTIDTSMGKVLDIESRLGLLRYPGGSMFELGCHVIDSVVKLLGRPKGVTAYNRRSRMHNDGLADNQLAVLEYEGATATVRSSLVEVDGMNRRRFEVCGEKGTLEIRPLEPPKVRLSLSEDRGEFKRGTQEVAMPRAPRYEGEFEDLAKVVLEGKKFGWDPDHDLAVQETVLLASGLKAS